MRRIAFFVASFFCFMACNNEVIYIPDVPLNETKPQIELFLPDAETVNVYSTATLSENTIDTVWVLVFNSGGVLQWVDTIAGSKVVRNGYASQLLPQLTQEPAIGSRIVCIANVDPNPTTVGVTPATINANFRIQNKGYYYGGESLPMYGDTIWSPASGYTIDMTRAVAKIQVQMGTSVSIADSAGNFSANSVRYKIYNGVRDGEIQPLSSGLSLGANAFSPETDYRYLMQYSNATEQNSSTYIFEFPSSTNYANSGGGPSASFSFANPASTFDARRLHLILEKDNTPDPPTFYRLDFYNPVTERFLDIVRNHHYLFTINRVRSEGYRTLAEAQNNPGSNIEYDVIIKDASTRMASNGQYAIVTTGGLDTLDFWLNDYPTIYTGTLLQARYHFPAEMGGIVSGTYNNIEVQTLSGSINAFTLASPATLSANFTNVDITVAVHPDLLNETIGVVIFRLGNITHRVPFKLHIPW